MVPPWLSGHKNTKIHGDAPWIGWASFTLFRYRPRETRFDTHRPDNGGVPGTGYSRLTNVLPLSTGSSLGHSAPAYVSPSQLSGDSLNTASVRTLPDQHCYTYALDAKESSRYPGACQAPGRIRSGSPARLNQDLKPLV